MYALLQKATNATSLYKFEKALEAIEEPNYNKGVAYRYWRSIKMDKTNFVESFNATLGVDKCKPVLTLFKGNLCFKLCCFRPYISCFKT